MILPAFISEKRSSMERGYENIRSKVWFSRMPQSRLLLTTENEADRWLTAPVEEALKLQRPLAADQMMVVAKGERKDEAA